MYVNGQSLLPQTLISSIRYKRAVGNQGKLVFSRPYVDAFGAGIVITMAETLVEGRCVCIQTL